MQRLEIRATGWSARTDAPMAMACTRCNWEAEVQDSANLAELMQRAEEHTEVCR